MSLRTLNVFLAFLFSFVMPGVGQVFNGQQFNGISINGQLFNGISINGALFNGVSINGAVFNGISINGVLFNGLGTNGILFNGAAQTACGNACETAVAPVVAQVRLADGALVAVK